jgi:hypothetical protein
MDTLLRNSALLLFSFSLLLFGKAFAVEPKLLTEQQLQSLELQSFKNPQAVLAQLNWLEQSISSKTSFPLKRELLILRGRVLYKNQNYSEFEKISEQLDKLSIAQQDIKGLGWAAIFKSVHYDILG